MKWRRGWQADILETQFGQLEKMERKIREVLSE